jgi:DNA-directed RNA polymerase alpha subunit
MLDTTSLPSLEDLFEENQLVYLTLKNTLHFQPVLRVLLMNELELLHVHNVGSIKVASIKKRLAEYGLDLRNSKMTYFERVDQLFADRHLAPVELLAVTPQYPFLYISERRDEVMYIVAQVMKKRNVTTIGQLVALSADEIEQTFLYKSDFVQKAIARLSWRVRGWGFQLRSL